MNRKNLFGILVTLLVLITGVMYWLIAKEQHSAIFESLNESQTSAVENYLAINGVPFEIDSTTNQILVSDKEKYRLRMELLSNGVISEGRVGFEIFNESDFGLTDFAQKVNFQRALQGELEKTIAEIDGVRNVRVHLKLATKKILFEKNRPVTASVVIYQKVGTNISNDKITGIRNLVAGAVDNLTGENVFIVDSSGKTLGNSTKDLYLSGNDSAKNSIEKKLIRQAEKILGAIYDKADYEVSVSVEVDLTSKVSEIESIPNSNGGALLKKKVITTALNSVDGKNKKISPLTEEVVYGYGKKIEKISYAPGKVLSVSVGVIINSTDSEEELMSLKKLLSAALGINSTRGDFIEILFVEKRLAIKNKNEPVKISNLRPKNNNLLESNITTALIVSNGVFLLIVLFLSIRIYSRKKLSNITLSDVEQKKMISDLREWVQYG